MSKVIGPGRARRPAATKDPDLKFLFDLADRMGYQTQKLAPMVQMSEHGLFNWRAGLYQKFAVNYRAQMLAKVFGYKFALVADDEEPIKIPSFTHLLVSNAHKTAENSRN